MKCKNIDGEHSIVHQGNSNPNNLGERGRGYVGFISYNFGEGVNQYVKMIVESGSSY